MTIIHILKNNEMARDLNSPNLLVVISLCCLIMFILKKTVNNLDTTCIYLAEAFPSVRIQTSRYEMFRILGCL